MSAFKPYEVQCRFCNVTLTLRMKPEDVQRWKGGELTQNAFPYLSADEREILISGMCGTCFDKMVGG